MAAVRRVFPDIDIRTEPSDDYPIKVEVVLNGKIVWSGDQRKLFRKNAQQRERSIGEIEAACQVFLEDLSRNQRSKK